jgi:hypothetical protein
VSTGRVNLVDAENDFMLLDERSGSLLVLEVKGGTGKDLF